MNIWWVFLLITVCSLGLTGLLRSYALAHSLLDIPNERSSHKISTPRGGGVAIVLTYLAGLLLLEALDVISGDPVWAMFGAGSVVALIGFLDDHEHIPARWRLMAHFIGASWALIWLGGLPPLPVLGFMLDLGWWGHLLAIMFLVWLLNLYNFMDGIDGIAGIEAVSVCSGGMLLYFLVLGERSEWMLPMLLLAAVAGFLFWNFPKARIFMGDAGSGFLGIIFGLLAIQAAWMVPELFWSWMILLGAFVVDASVTLFRRVIRGEKFYEAHRSHAYQVASRNFDSHVSVSLAFGAINLLWLLPVALIVGIGWLDGVFGLIIAYLPLILLAFRFKAGAKELQVD